MAERMRPVGVTFEPDRLRAGQALAEQEKITFSAVVRRALDRYLAAMEAKHMDNAPEGAET